MNHFRLRFISILITGYPCPVSDVDIFQVCKVLFVKQPDLVKYLFSIDCGTCTCRKDLPWSIIFLYTFILSICKCPSKCIIISARTVYSGLVMVLNHLRLNREYIRCIFYRTQQISDIIFSYNRIIIQQDHIRCICLFYSDIDSSAKSIVLIQKDTFYFRIFFFDRFNAPVIRSIVNNQYSFLCPVLFIQTLYTGKQVFFSFIVWYYNCYFTHNFSANSPLKNNPIFSM